MQFKIVLGIIYLAILKLTRSRSRAYAVPVQPDGIVWGSVAPRERDLS